MIRIVSPRALEAPPLEIKRGDVALVKSLLTGSEYLALVTSNRDFVIFGVIRDMGPTASFCGQIVALTHYQVLRIYPSVTLTID